MTVCVWVSNLPNETSEADIQALFSQYAAVQGVRLFSGEPFWTTGPLKPPRETDRAVRKSTPCSGELLPWQVKQYVDRIGRTSFSNNGTPSAAGAAAGR